MAIYTLSPASLANSAARLRKIRIWGSGIVITLLLLLVCLRIYLSNALGHNFDFLGIAFFVLLMNFIQPYPWRRSALKVAEEMGNIVIEITPEVVEYRSKHFNRRIARDQILRVEEARSGGGLYLRTANRYCWIMISRQVEGYDEIKSSLAASGIQIVRTMIPPNWEEFLFALLFCGSVACDLFATSRIVLCVNLVVALLLGVLGFLVTATIENSRLRFKTRLGSLIPLAAACLTLLLRFARF